MNPELKKLGNLEQQKKAIFEAAFTKSPLLTKSGALQEMVRLSKEQLKLITHD